MKTTPRNANKRWTDPEVRRLKQLAKKNTQTELIAKELERTKAAIYSKASDENISLMPMDKKHK